MSGKYVLIDVGEFGFTAYEETRKVKGGSTKSRLSGYDKNIDFIVERHKENIVDGCVVVDKVGPDLYHNSPTFVSDVMGCPIVDVDLEPGEVEECPEINPILLGGLQGTFKSLALRRSLDKKWRGLDSISIIDYAAYWSKRGARIGIWNGDSVEWEG